jgi:hypothetical protein
MHGCLEVKWWHIAARGCQRWCVARGGVHLGKEVLVIPRGLEEKFFPWVFGGVVLAVVILDVALIWVLFLHPNSRELVMSLPFLPR